MDLKVDNIDKTKVSIALFQVVRKTLVYWPHPNIAMETLSNTKKKQEQTPKHGQPKGEKPNGIGNPDVHHQKGVKYSSYQTKKMLEALPQVP